MQSADALHLVLANVQDSGQASAALTISSSAGITAPAELTDQLLADLRKPEEHYVIRGLALLSNLLQQADSAAASELLKDTVPLLGNLLLKSSVATQEACLSAALKIVHSAQAFPDQGGIRKDVSALATKCCSWILSKGCLVHGQSFVAAGSARVQLKLLQACLTVVPSFLRQLKGLAEALEGLLLSCASEPDSSSQLLYEIGCCCALLPAATGTAEAWTTAALRIASTAQDVAASMAAQLQGTSAQLISRTASSAASMDLGPCKVAGLGAHMQLLTQLLYCLAHMLRQPYPCPVPLPGQALLGLASSVLQIQPADLHTLPAAAAAASITRLGSCQVAALQLLHALIKAGGPALLPLADGCARLLRPLLQALADGALVPGPSTPPGMTTAVQVAQTCSALLEMGGPGIARLLHPAVHAFCASAHSEQQPQLQPDAGIAGRQGGKKSKKRRLQAEAAAFTQSSAVPAGQVRALELACQEAALQLLTSLIRVGGAWLPAEQRLQADALCLQAAQIHCCSQDRPGQSTGGQAAAQAARQAALQALLTSVLVPCSHSPPFLAQALAVFRKEAAGGDAALRQTARCSLLACEALLHPRSCPPAPSYSLLQLARPPANPVSLSWAALDSHGQQQQHSQQQQQINIDPALRAQPQAADSSLPAAQRLSANGNVSEHGLREASRHQQAGGQITALELDGSGSGLPQLHPGSQNGTMDPVASTAKEPGSGLPAIALTPHNSHQCETLPVGGGTVPHAKAHSQAAEEHVPTQQSLPAGQGPAVSGRQPQILSESHSQQGAVGNELSAKSMLARLAQEADDEPFPDIDSGPSGSSEEDEDEELT